MPTPSNTFHKDQKATERPIWREYFVGLDWMSLRTSPVYYGMGVPRGASQAVIAIPGFMGTDLYLQELYWWFRRIGYRPYLSRIGRNADCLDVLVDRLSDTIEKAYKETGGPAHLVGHSLGGILALSAASLRPDMVASVITLGSPFRGIRSHPMVIEMAKIVRARITSSPDRRKPACYTGYCDCDAVSALQKSCPRTIPHTAIYTRTDGIVDWRVCINEDLETNFEVTGTHVGLVFNPSVYELIANRLAGR